ncbi:MAG: trigger factor [Candidatus Sungbacteria bacterium]|nr:trigger factor [Candidatus Sungbacteria bacterium]
MNYKCNKLPHSEIEVEITLPFAEFESQVKRAVVLLSEEIEIEGFRKGKAPYEMVKQRIGEAAIYERAADIAVRKVWSEVFDRMTVLGELSAENPLIGRPEVSITKLAPGNDLEFKVKITILPSVKLPDYQAIAKRVRGEKKEIAVEDKEIDEALNWLRDSRTKLVTVDREAKKGDRVEVDFQISRGGVKIENGESKNHPLILGQEKFLPGFEGAVMGMKKGDKKEFTLEIPKNWHDDALAGKPFDFSVTMGLVQDRQTPEATDEFAKTLGNYESLDALKANIREGLETEKKEKESQRIKALMIEDIAKQAEIDVPETLVTSELEKMKQELDANITQVGMKWEDYLLHIKKSEEDLKRDWREEAVRRVRIALCLRAIANEEHVTAPEEEIAERAQQYLQRFGSIKEAEKAIDPEALREYIRGIVRNEKVFSALENIK